MMPTDCPGPSLAGRKPNARAPARAVCRIGRRTRPRTAGFAACAGIVAVLIAAGAATAQNRKVPDKFTAVTSHMQPAGVNLEMDVVSWSTPEQRAAVVAALAADSDDTAALRDLPTVGYVWTSGSSVGYSLKYAERESTTDGGETVTLVTDKPLGAYDNEPWEAEGSAPTAKHYTVIELMLDSSGAGHGTLSLAADVAVDKDANRVRLTQAESAPALLSEAVLAPKPYWAKPQETAGSP